MKRRSFLRGVLGACAAGLFAPKVLASTVVDVSMAPRRVVLRSGAYILRRANDLDGWDQFECCYGREEFIGFVSDEHLAELGITPEEDLRRWGA